MGGILGNKAWMRSNGGLWVSNVFGMPETVYGWCCCGEEEPPSCQKCECPACKESITVPGKHFAPCCWKVIVAGIAATDPEQCADCDDLNATYYLSQDPEMPCLWKSTVCKCGETAITLEISESNDQYTITVTLGGHVWSKTYGSPPDCCAIAEELLTHQSSSGECDSSSATCEISAAYDGDCRGYYCMDVEVSQIDRNNGDCGCPSCDTLNKAWKLPMVSGSKYGYLPGKSIFFRTLCSSDDPYYRCGYSHIQSEINIASEEATTGTVQLWIFQYTGHINKDPHEDSGSFMYWSATVTREEGQTWAEALGEYITLTYKSQSGADEFDCDGSSATVKIKVVAYTPSCLGVCEPGAWCVSRPATCKTVLHCYGDEWPERLDVIPAEGMICKFPYLSYSLVGWDYTPIEGATLTYHDEHTDHPELLPFDTPIGGQAGDACGYQTFLGDRWFAGKSCMWSYLSEPFEAHYGPHDCGPPYFGYKAEYYTRWRFSMSAWNKYASDAGGKEWAARISICSYLWWFNTLYAQYGWQTHYVVLNLYFNASQDSPCEGSLLDCFLGGVPLALNYWDTEYYWAGPYDRICIPHYPWALCSPGVGNITIEPA